MATIMTATLIFSGINVLLIGSLFMVYVKSYMKMRSSFTLGLFFFGLLFLVHNVLYVYFALTMMDYYAAGAQTYGLLFTVLQTIAFGVLAVLTWK